MGDLLVFRPTGLRQRKPCQRAVSADVWYERAVAAEGTDAKGAIALYRRCLAANPEHPDAHCNLGRLLHEAGELPGAEAHYRLALCAIGGPSVIEIGIYWFNLGVAVEDQRRRAEAVACYRAALAHDDSLADAHWNLARLLDVPGDAASQSEALRHLAAYKLLRPIPATRTRSR